MYRTYVNLYRSLPRNSRAWSHMHMVDNKVGSLEISSKVATLNTDMTMFPLVLLCSIVFNYEFFIVEGT